MEIELGKHIDLIDDDRIKAYIAKKKEERKVVKEARQGIHSKKILAEESDDEMVSLSSDQISESSEEVKVKALAKVKTIVKKIKT